MTGYLSFLFSNLPLPFFYHAFIFIKLAGLKSTQTTKSSVSLFCMLIFCTFAVTSCASPCLGPGPLYFLLCGCHPGWSALIKTSNSAWQLADLQLCVGRNPWHTRIHTHFLTPPRGYHRGTWDSAYTKIKLMIWTPKLVLILYITFEGTLPSSLQLHKLSLGLHFSRFTQLPPS